MIEPSGIEIMEPLLPDGPTSKRLEKDGEGVICLSLKVSDLDEAMAQMKSRGIRLIGQVRHRNTRSALYHPRDTHGVGIGLIEYEAEHPSLSATGK